MQHGLGGDAAHVQAGATQGPSALHADRLCTIVSRVRKCRQGGAQRQAHLQAQLGSLNGGHIPAGASSNDHYVVVWAGERGNNMPPRFTGVPFPLVPHLRQRQTWPGQRPRAVKQGKCGVGGTTRGYSVAGSLTAREAAAAAARAVLASMVDTEARNHKPQGKRARSVVLVGGFAGGKVGTGALLTSHECLRIAGWGQTSLWSAHKHWGELPNKHNSRPSQELLHLLVPGVSVTVPVSPLACFERCTCGVQLANFRTPV